MFLDIRWLYLVLGVLTCYYIAIARRRKYLRVTTGVPNITGLPLLGIVHKLIPIKKFFYTLQAYFEDLQSWTYCMWVGPQPHLVTIDPTLIKEVLSSEVFLNKASKLYAPIDFAIPHGLITSKVIKWRHNRKLMNLSFSNKILTSFIPIFTNGTQLAIQLMNEMVGKGECYIFDKIKRSFFHMAFETTMGVNLQGNLKTHDDIIDGFNYMIECAFKESLLGTLSLGFLVRTPKYYRTIHFIREYVEKLIKSKYKHIENFNNNNNSQSNAQLEEDDGIKKNAEIFINQALSYHERGLFQLDDVLSETETVIAGSFETVSTTVYSVLVMLAMHPHIQQQLYEDIHEILPSKDIPLENEHLKQFPLLDRIIDETLRLMPSIPLIAREAISDTILESKIKLPKGMQVMIPIFLLHRRKDIWGPTANDFNPDNFLPENINQRPQYAYIPFSKGPRNCIGMRYANIALHVMLLELLRNFQFSTTFKYEDMVFVDHISLRYEKEPQLEIARRP